MLNLLNDILDYSKIEAGHLNFDKKPFRLVDAIRNSTLLFALKLEEKNLLLKTELAPDLPLQLIGDSMRLEQVLNNLIGNAIKFTTEGEIGLKVETLSLPDHHQPFARLRFSVSDTGIGIKPEFLQRLFTPFRQVDDTISRRFGGTGLGLSICKRLVELMGGEIMVSSVEGQGSLFSFSACFECVNPSELTLLGQDRLAEVDQALKAIQGAEILLVEDNVSNQLVAQGYLEKLRLKVTVAENGLEAIQSVEKKAFDAVLMDIQMPIMDGYEATRQIRLLPQGQSLPIIAISASVMTDAKQACLDAGMNDHLAKPIDFDLLANCLIKWVKPKASPETPLTDEKNQPATPTGIAREIDQDTLQPLLEALEQLLGENMLDAKKVAERIDNLLDNTPLAPAFFPVSDLIRKMHFKQALVALHAFKQRLTDNSR